MNKTMSMMAAALFLLVPLTITDVGADHEGDPMEHCTDIGGAAEPGACGAFLTSQLPAGGPYDEDGDGTPDGFWVDGDDDGERDPDGSEDVPLAQAPSDCTPEGDPLWTLLCLAAVGAGGSLTEQDADDDGRADTAFVSVQGPVGGSGSCPPGGDVPDLDVCGEMDMPIFFQLDFFFSPDTTPPAEVAGAEFFDVSADIMLYDPQGAYLGQSGGHDETQFRVTNHYGVPRDDLSSLTGYTGVYDFDDNEADGYGACWVCVQPDTNRLAVRAGPATFEENNGAPGTLGLLEASDPSTDTGSLTSTSVSRTVNRLDEYPGYAFDLDIISPADSLEIEDSIQERVYEATDFTDAAGTPVPGSLVGQPVDSTPTKMLVSQKMANQETGSGNIPDVDFPDGQPVHLRFYHVKWQGDRGQPADLFGSHTKYSNLDDDPDTDQEELLCVGQPTNPVNPDAFCIDWDGDGIANEPDPEPISPNVFVNIAWLTGDDDADGEYDDAVEAPFLPPIDFTCTGTTSDMLVQRSLDQGETWDNWEGHSNSGSASMPSGCDNVLGHDRPLTTDNTQDEEWWIRVVGVNARDTPFPSDDVLKVTIKGNAEPDGAPDVYCNGVASAGDPDPCTDNTHTQSSVEYVWRWTPVQPPDSSPGGVGADDPTQVISTAYIEDWISRDGDTTIGESADRLHLTKQADGSWEAPWTYASSTHDRTARLVIGDNGGSSRSYSVDLDLVPAAPSLSSYGSAEDAIDEESATVSTFLRVADSNSGASHTATMHYAIQAPGEPAPAPEDYEALAMTETFCDIPVSSTPNALVAEVQMCPEYWIDFVLGWATYWVGTVQVPYGSELHYYFEATDTDDGLGSLGAADAPERHAAGEGPVVSGGILDQIPDPLDYILGDCNLLADAISRGTGAGPAPNCDNFDAESYLEIVEGFIPGDEIDYRDTDGDPSNDDEPNGQVDYIEMYVASFDFTEDGRPSVRFYRPTGVTPTDHEEVRITVDDNPETADKQEIVLIKLDGQDSGTVRVSGMDVSDGTFYGEPEDFFYCAYLDGEGALNVGEGHTEAEACSAADVTTAYEVETENGARIVDSSGNPVLGITTAENLYSSVIHLGPGGEETLGGLLGMRYDEESDTWFITNPDDGSDVAAAPGQDSGLPDPNTLCDDPETQTFPDCLAGDPSPPDADGDGVPDEEDDCDNTPDGEAVDENGCSESQGGNPPAQEECEGTDVAGNCLPTNEIPDLNDLCEEGEFPDCLGADPFAVVDEAAGIPPCPDDLPRDQPVYICRIQEGQQSSFLSGLTGGAWPGYLILVGGVLPIAV